MVELSKLFASSLKADLQQRSLQQLTLISWCQKFFPHYFNLPPSALHVEIAEEFDRIRFRRGNKINIIAPRGSAKSTLASFGMVMRAICEKTEDYVILAADTYDQAKKYVEAIRDELENNEELERAYPDAVGVGREWNKESIITANGVKIEALSTGMKMRGRKRKQYRPTLVVVDDPEGDDASYSATIRRRTWEWFTKAVLKSGSPRTNFIVASTNVHRECLVSRIQGTPSWKTYVYRALISYPDNMHLWQQWKDIYCSVVNKQAEEDAELFYRKNRKEMKQGARVLWPQLESLYDLMKMWAEDRNAFESEKQNNPIDPESCEWDDTYFDYEGFWYPSGEMPDSKNCDVRAYAIDPSKGKDAKRGDYSAIVYLVRHNNGEIFVKSELRRIPTPQLVDQVVEDLRVLQPDIFGCETNQFQELLGEDIVERCKSEHIFCPYYPLENTVNKQVRIRRIGPFLSQRQLRFADNPATKMLVNQLRDFPNGDHDDGPDALEMALRCAIVYYNTSNSSSDIGGTFNVV